MLVFVFASHIGTLEHIRKKQKRASARYLVRSSGCIIIGTVSRGLIGAVYSLLTAMQKVSLFGKHAKKTVECFSVLFSFF